MPKTPYSIMAVITLVAGASRGRHELRLAREDPSGLIQQPPFIASVQMEGEDRSQNIVVNMQFVLETEGLHWFHLYLGDVLLTKMPFRVSYARISAGASPLPGTPGQRL